MTELKPLPTPIDPLGAKISVYCQRKVMEDSKEEEKSEKSLTGLFKFIAGGRAHSTG